MSGALTLQHKQEVDCGAPLHRLPYVLHPGVPLVSRVGVDLIHLGPHRGSGDQEHPSLLVGHLSDDQLLQWDHRRLLVLVRQEQTRGVKNGFKGCRATSRT